MSDRTQGLTYTAAFKGIERLLEAKSNIVIDLVGHGGIGKTQLVQELAQRKIMVFMKSLVLFCSQGICQCQFLKKIALLTI